MKRNWGWIVVAAALLVPTLAYGAGDIVLEGLTVTDAFAQNGDVHVRFATSAPAPAPQGVCDVTLVTVHFDFVNGDRALLKANCGAQLTSINWLRNGSSVRGEVDTLPRATGDVYFISFIYPKTNVFTAVGNKGAIPAGASAAVQNDYN